MFANDFTHGGPNSHVLVLGSGSGSEIIGALSNGNSVVAFEYDLEQYKGSLTRINNALGAHEKLTGHFASDAAPAKLITELERWQWIEGDVGHFDRRIPVTGILEEFKAVRKEWKTLTTAVARVEEEKMELPADWVGDCCYGCGCALRDPEAILKCKECEAKSCVKCALVTEGVCRDCSAKSAPPPDVEEDEELTPPIVP
jgi:hypothetical protein